MITSTVRMPLVSVPGTRWLILVSRCDHSGLKIATMSDRPMSAVSRAAVPGTQERCRLRSTGSPGAAVISTLPPLGRPALVESPASSLSVISAALLSGPRPRRVSVVIASPRVLLSRYLPSLGGGPGRGTKFAPGRRPGRGARAGTAG